MIYETVSVKLLYLNLYACLYYWKKYGSPLGKLHPFKYQKQSHYEIEHCTVTIPFRYPFEVPFHEWMVITDMLAFFGFRPKMAYLEKIQVS